MTTEETLPSKETWDRLNRAFLLTGDWARALAERTAAVDRLVEETAASHLFPAVGDRAALVAVGGYGRRHLFPCSDIDLVLLFDAEEHAHAAREAIAAFLKSLWDAGLRVSQSVRTPEECAALHDRNVEFNISLLDERFLAGSRALYAAMRDRLSQGARGQREELVRHLSRMTRERHSKYEGTYCHLEPNIKETPGGLRDLQLAAWLERLRQAEADDAGELREAWAFLARLRTWLHCRWGRDNNVLDFEAQEAAAELWQEADAAGWMREYYRHARTVYRAARRALDAAEGQNSNLLAQFREWRARLSNADFSVSRERILLRAPHTLEADPDLLLRLFRFQARHGIDLAGDTAHRIRENRPRMAAWFGETQPIWPAVNEACSLPHTPLALRSLHETGALGVIFPELEQIDCLTIRDFYHRYTVDEHTLMAVRNIWELRQTADPARRIFGDILSELEQPGLLVFALLFHDVGKAQPAGGHVEGSLGQAERAMSRIQMPPAERATVRFLIGNHLVMPAFLRSRDLSDPATGREMAHLAGTVERLKALTLMSYADVSAVNPTAMSPWRAEQLWRLYLLAYNELTRELDAERIDSSESVAAPFLEGFPTRYLRTHGDADLEAHLRLEETSRARGVAIEIARLDNTWRATLVTRDRPSLFAAAAGTLAGFGMNILKAEAFSNRAGTVLDTFRFADPLRTLELNPSETERLRSTLERVVLGKLDVRQLLRHRPQPAPPSRKARIRHLVSFDGNASATATLVQIVAEDRPGLLYDLASAISEEGCDIQVVLVDTEAHKAIDVFYVTEGGGKLTPAFEERLGVALRRACAGG